jgi:addiction module RelE/StbE family toxin
MINVLLSKTFIKQIRHLKPAQQKRLQKAVKLFKEDPFHETLYNHSLTGEWSGYRSIAFGGDWRAHYKMVDDNSALFEAVGTHSQLYD